MVLMKERSHTIKQCCYTDSHLIQNYLKIIVIYFKFFDHFLHICYRNELMISVNYLQRSHDVTAALDITDVTALNVCKRFEHFNDFRVQT